MPVNIGWEKPSGKSKPTTIPNLSNVMTFCASTDGAAGPVSLGWGVADGASGGGWVCVAESASGGSEAGAHPERRRIVSVRNALRVMESYLI
jgi:hypothetical protein